MRLLICALALLVGCQPAADSAVPESLLSVVGQLQDPAIDEASGLATSRRDPDVLWVINDDGPAVLYAINGSGAALAKVKVSKAENRDWEDLASFTMDGKPYLLIADIGDNEARFRKVTLYVVEEPDIDDEKTKIAWQINFRYPDGPTDAESIAVDVAGDRILIVTKRDIPAVLYELPLRPDTKKTILANRLGALASLPQPRRQDVVNAPLTDVWYWQPIAMDINEEGNAALISTYGALYYYSRASDESWQQALAKSPLRQRLGKINEMEAITFSADGGAAFLTNEARHAPLLRLDLSGAASKSLAVTIMNFNAQNLFDNEDDPVKDDKAYLPIAAKRTEEHIAGCNTIPVRSWREECLTLDWSDSALQHKLQVLAETIRQIDDGRGADIVVLQEIENATILDRLRTEYLAESDYLPAVLVEGTDLRGIDVAFLSRLPLTGAPKLHPFIVEDYPDRAGDTRGVLEATFELPDGSLLTGFSVHFPNPAHPVEMRELAYEHLNSLRDALPAENSVFAAGDFNTTSTEDAEQQMLNRFVRPFWTVAHDACDGCRGTYYYAPDNNWSFLDMILFAPGRSEKTTWQIRADSVHIANRLGEQVTKDGAPKRYDAVARSGVSDHWPVALTLEPMQKQ